MIESDMIDVRDWIANHAYRSPDAIAQIDIATGRTFTYANMNMRVGRIAAHLRHNEGVAVGEVVAVIGDNSSDIFDIDFACSRCGAIFFPMNVRLKPAELAYQLGDAMPKVIFVGAGYETLIAEAISQSGSNPKVLGMSNAAIKPDIEDLIARGSDGVEFERRHPSDGWTLIYSSGTTGKPKGVLHTHGGVVMHAISCIGLLGLGPSDCGLAVLPLFHISGLNVFAHAMFYVGARQATLNRFDAKVMLDVLSNPDIGVTHFSAVPTIFEIMSQLPDFDGADTSSVKGAFVGGSPATEALLKVFNAKGMPLIQGYGLTEAGPTLTVLDAKDVSKKLGSVGKSLMHVEIRIVDDNGVDVADGEAGEIIARGPAIIRKYFKRPDAQETDFFGEWLRTGDIGRRDTEGFYYIVDRKKDMFISGGENVYPAEVENCIANIDGVIQVAVIGVPDEKWGQTGVAFVVKCATSELSDQDIINQCDKNLARYKIPNHIRFVDHLPLGGTGKVLKGELYNKLNT